MSGAKILNFLPLNSSLQDSLSRELSISRIVAQLLVNRGIRTAGEGEKFLHPKLADLHDPFLFSDMDTAVRLIKKSAKKKAKAIVFSDYDADGITSLVVLKDTLAKLGLEVFHYIPHRVKEGYGLNKKVLDLVKEKKAELLITADCGINSHEQVKELNRLGVDVVITDHHEPQSKDSLPKAKAIINPKINGSGYPYRDLAGVGVVYKLCQALTGDLLKEELDLVSLGTIADSVPLTGENRIIAREGLIKIRGTKRPGLQVLLESSGIKGKKMTTEYVSFILGPRINASGRIDSADIALKLLSSRDMEEAKGYAQTIERCNRQRQKIESVILQEARDLIDKEINFKEHKVVVVAKEGWHTGVLGIVAAKLSEKFFRPTILISLTDNLCRGSGRSIKNFHLFQALLDCEDLLDSFGGHRHATGLVISKDKIEIFKNRINHLVKERLSFQDLIPSIDIDAQVNLSQIDSATIAQLQLLEPFGSDNPEPLFYTKGLKLKGQPQILGRQTLKLWATDGALTYPVIGFGMAGFLEDIIQSDSFDLVYKLRIDSWRGEDSLILEIKDIFFSKSPV
ncbi:MAG: single-stranded-DNA-specific exonuclease RecJ [Candidatus Omnitrophota bacterium]